MEQVDRQRRSKERRSVAVVSADSIIPRLQRLVCPLDSVSRVCRIYVSEEVVCYTGGGGL